MYYKKKKRSPNISTFIPTPKVYNKYKRNLELESFYSLMKRITPFTVIKNKKLTVLLFVCLFIYLIFIYKN